MIHRSATSGWMLGLAIVLGLSVTAMNTAPATAAEPAKTEAKKKKMSPKRLYLRRTCIACHGKNGARSIQDYPNIAGQNPKYMIRQIKDILKGKRTGSPDATGNPRADSMRGSLVTPEGEHRISSEEIVAISEWLAEQTPAKPIPLETPLTEDQVKAAKKLYKKKCMSCHGKDAKKTKVKDYPIIGGQKRNYIVTQITDIRSKARKHGKTATMIPFVKKLTEAEIRLLADYLSQIDRSK
ncbi:MAG: hypothetical protein C0605_06430 [Hyphomicrobiales bacterium]|nr:MAG: hypothetical protein C0605_06430 [Hyphomicrobiales bacterium]